MIDHSILELNQVTKSFLSGKTLVKVLENLSLSLKSKEIVSIIGPNGCGKTTLFNIIVGLDKDFTGQLITSKNSSSEKKIPGFVFQQYENSLMPWLTCKDNILFPLSQDKSLSDSHKNEVLVSLLDSLGLTRLPLQSYPYQMSGGEKQMACIARAMIGRPDLLLLDEPFSSLDYLRKKELYELLQKVHLLYNTAILLITHNIDEGILLSDRVLVLSNKPTHILKEVTVGLQRPRSESDYSKEEFIRCREEIIRHFEKLSS